LPQGIAFLIMVAQNDYFLGNFRRSGPALMYIFKGFPEEVLYARWCEVYKVIT
jgi:hypothetical protein